MAHTLRASAHGFHPVAFFASLREAWARYRLYRQTVSELVGLSDRELADLGLHRSHIRSVAREHAYGA